MLEVEGFAVKSGDDTTAGNEWHHDTMGRYVHFTALLQCVLGISSLPTFKVLVAYENISTRVLMFVSLILYDLQKSTVSI